MEWRTYMYLLTLGDPWGEEGTRKRYFNTGRRHEGRHTVRRGGGEGEGDSHQWRSAIRLSDDIKISLLLFFQADLFLDLMKCYCQW